MQSQGRKGIHQTIYTIRGHVTHKTFVSFHENSWKCDGGSQTEGDAKQPRPVVESRLNEAMLIEGLNERVGAKH